MKAESKPNWWVTDDDDDVVVTNIPQPDTTEIVRQVLAALRSEGSLANPSGHAHESPASKLRKAIAEDSVSESEDEDLLLEQRCISDPLQFPRLRQQWQRNKIDPGVKAVLESELDFIESLVEHGSMPVTQTKTIARRLIFLSLRAEHKISPMSFAQVEREIRASTPSSQWKSWWRGKNKLAKTHGGFRTPYTPKSKTFTKKPEDPKNGK